MNPGLNDLTQPQENQLRLEINVNEFNVIMAGLQELPHRVSDPVIKKIFAQAQQQLNMNK